MFTLFDIVAMHSFVSTTSARKWAFQGAFEPKTRRIQTAGAEKIDTMGIHRDVHVLLGMDWLSRHQVVLYCKRARVHIPFRGERVTFQGTRFNLGLSIISMLHAEELSEKGVEGFMAIL
ncbi:unnamed protein product [Cochlearia groenlandica]